MFLYGLFIGICFGFCAAYFFEAAIDKYHEHKRKKSNLPPYMRGPF